MSDIETKSFDDTDSLLNFLSESANDGFKWYRGHADSNWKLLPQIFRDATHDEFGLLKSFQQKSASFTDAPQSMDLAHWVSLAQHNGLPTRVLDWSESFLVALFFATREPLWPSSAINGGGEIAVWLVNPVQLNRCVMGGEFVKFDEGMKKVGVCSEADEPMLVHMMRLFGLDYPGTPYPCVAYSPQFRHPRMFNQKAAFTWHDNSLPLEEMADSHKFLKKIVFPAKAREQLAAYLTILGITHSTLFPDFGGVAHELKNRMRLA